MRRVYALATIVTITLGCSGDPDDSASTSGKPSGDQQANISEDVQFGQGQPVYLQKPLNYWVAQAKSADRQEDVERVVEALTLALGSEDLSVVVAAGDAMAVLGPTAKSAAPMLVGKLNHVQPWVRCSAMDALAAMGADAVPALVDTLKNGPGNAPIRAAIVMENIGPAAKDAIPTLEQVMQDNPNWHDRITAVLGRIDPTRADTTSEDPAPREVDTVVVPPAPTLERAADGDWAEFHGPMRDSLSAETGLLKQWPEGGPELLWQLTGLGRGFSTVSIADGKIFTMGDRPDGDDESQFVIAYDLATRDELWATRVGAPHNDGPRCTPTVDGSLLYVLGTDGNLVCLAAATGEVRWQKSLPDDFGGRVMKAVWKFCESPLVDGDRLICTPGGEEATIVALEKTTGELLWTFALPDIGRGGSDGAGYSSIVAAEIGGVRQYVQLLGRGLVGVEAETGKLLWSYNRIANTTANITMPVVRGNLVFATTSYTTGSALVRINQEGDGFTAEEIYFLGPREFENHHGGVVLVGNHVYGGHAMNRGAPTCIDLGSGEIVWQEDALARGSAAVTYADGHLIFRYDRGLVALVEATPEAFRVKGTFEAFPGEGPAWAHPVVHDRKLYLRHGDVLECYDLAESE